MKQFFISMAMLCLPFMAMAQFDLSGKILDSETYIPLSQANILIKNTYLASSSNQEGFYEFKNLKAGEYEIWVSYLGYETSKFKINLTKSEKKIFRLKRKNYLVDEVIISATRANENTPTTFTNVSKENIEKVNLGQDIPILLQMTPSLVATSDAGAGVGYTGLRIRGSDASRINVTINGVPLNDSESQGVFWVNMPDFASSLENVQIQRGAGTSTNGAGAFGASINLQTNALKQNAYGEVNNSFGSFNTRKHTLAFGSGLINGKWAFDGRLSQIASDGYIDRASSDLKSFYFSGGYYGKKSILKAIVFSGKEITYQSWYGTPESRINGDEEAMRTHAANEGYSTDELNNLLNSGRTYNFYRYDNEVDNYQQDHYQLHFSHQYSRNWRFTSALHYTKGKGYFEQFREDDDFSDYGFPNPIIGNDTIESGDFIRRRWLDNDFYGLTFNLNYTNNKLDFTLGGAANQYDGNHFGEIIWAEYAKGLNIRDEYYRGWGKKRDINIFAKANYQISSKINLFADLQVRNVNYTVTGIDNDLRNLDVAADFLFFNPKLGFNFQVNPSNKIYFLFSTANREPSRNDFIDAIADRTPKAETLYDFELGYKRNRKKYSFEANAYYMMYKNQLVLTGELNDVGSAVRENVANSYRAGIELQFAWAISKKFQWMANATFSQNKIRKYKQFLYDYTNGFDIITNEYKDVDIAFSPNVIAANQLIYKPIKNLEIALMTRHVGKQFLDNTELRSMQDYLVQDLRINYNFKVKNIKNIGLSLLINNLLNEEYSSNGYTYSYKFGEIITENFFYPQAGTNFLLGLNLRF